VLPNVEDQTPTVKAPRSPSNRFIGYLAL